MLLFCPGLGLGNLNLRACYFLVPIGLSTLDKVGVPLSRVVRLTYLSFTPSPLRGSCEKLQAVRIQEALMKGSWSCMRVLRMIEKCAIFPI